MNMTVYLVVVSFPFLGALDCLSVIGLNRSWQRFLSIKELGSSTTTLVNESTIRMGLTAPSLWNTESNLPVRAAMYRIYGGCPGSSRQLS